MRHLQPLSQVSRFLEKIPFSRSPATNLYLKPRMAQKRDHEQATETDRKVPEPLTLFAQACGFSASEQPRSKSPSPPETSDSTIQKSDQGAVGGGEVNRCSLCKRKVGLIGFRCRCGEMFCSKHRYSDRHECRFDYKAAGQAMIMKENPVVRPAKILKV